MKHAGIHAGRIAGLLLLLILGTVSGVRAQTNTSSIRGLVLDASGPLAEATVEAVGTQSGFRYTAKTGADGSFSLAGLTPGVYTVTVSSSAYAPQSRTVQVLIGQDVDASFVLSPDQVFTEDVTVVGESVQLLLETRTSEIATNVTTQQIEDLPQNNRNFLGLAVLAPGVRITENQDEAGQKFRSGGADARQINVFIDGLSYKNDLLQGGAFMQDSSRGNPFPQNAVQEFRVLTQNYKAEYEKSASAVITAVTKSGGNNFHGDVFYLFQDKGFVTQDDFSRDRNEEKPDYDRDQYGLSLGGPIRKDSLHFFLSYEGNDQDRNATIFRGSSFNSAPASVQELLSGYETGVLTSPFESDLYFGKLSWQPADGQTLYTTFHRRDEQEVRGFGGQRTVDGAESFEVGTDAFVAKHTWIIGNFLNEATGTFQKLQWSPTALFSDSPRQNFIGILDVGGKDATQDFQQDRIGLRDDVSTTLTWRGDHNVKAGASINWLDYKVEKNTFENGLFEYRSDEQWLFPFQARVGFGDPKLEFSNTQFGLYLQDDWRIGNVTLNLGVRWDYESNMINNDYRTPPELVTALESACRTYGAPVGGQSTWCLRDFLDLDSYTTDGNDRDPYYGMVQPRLGFAWDVRGNGKTVVFGGWGKYYDRVILNDIFDEQYRQQFKVYSFCFSADGSPAPNCSVPALAWRPEYLSADALRALVASGQAPGPEVFLVDNEMHPPRSDQWTLGVRHQFGNWLTGLSYAGVQSYNNLMYFFGDLPPGTRFEDRFGNNVQVPGFARVFVTSTARRTWYDAIYLTIDRPIAAGSGRWGFNLAYTYAEAEQTGTDNPGEGLAFGAFDYLSSESLYRFPGTNDERHRLVMSGTVALPANFQFSSLITLGSGVPFTVFDDSVAPFTVRWNEGRPEQFDFVAPDTWAYRSVDMRLEWQAPPIANAAVTLIAEGFNVFDFDNYGCFNNSIPRLPATNEDFGEPQCEFNTRRFQAGVRVGF